MHKRRLENKMVEPSQTRTTPINWHPPDKPILPNLGTLTALPVPVVAILEPIF